ncbi:MAG: hypothetical protein LJE96_12725 [Deltaproteobacteria bacterium]|nr:hypothetical protein [Deltaproteobacteria bacterium]
MEMAKKEFKKFILEASNDSSGSVSEDGKNLISGFYDIVSQETYEDEELAAYLDRKGFCVTKKDLRKIRNLHMATDSFFEVHNRDY